MDYEKKYKETLERAKSIKDSIIASHNKESARYYTGFINNIFPELKESEDERIRKAIIEQLKSRGQGSFAGYPMPDILAWLEKQKDLTKEGIIKQLEEEFYACGTTPKWFHDTVQGAINHGRAEALGEIKAHEPVSTIEQKEQKPIPKFKVGDCIYDKRDSYNRNVIREVGEDYYINAFAQKMDMAYTDANFEFLEHLDNDIPNSKPLDLSEKIEELCSKYPLNKDVMSEQVLSAYHQGLTLGATKIAEYLGAQKPAEGTALQKAFIGSKIDYTLEEKCDASDYADAILPTSVAYGENEEEYKLHKIIEAAFIAGQKKESKFAEWSEEDEKMFELLRTCVCRCINDDRFDYAEREQISRRLIPFIERLKSLRLHPHWKPSEEQMCELNWASKLSPVLESLYDDLKKL